MQDLTNQVVYFSIALLMIYCKESAHTNTHSYSPKIRNALGCVQIIPTYANDSKRPCLRNLRDFLQNDGPFVKWSTNLKWYVLLYFYSNENRYTSKKIFLLYSANVIENNNKRM